MKTYKITIPAFSEEISAKNEAEALESFMFDYDNAQANEPDLKEPIIEEIKKPKR